MSFLHGNGCLIKAAFNGDLMTVLIADKTSPDGNKTKRDCHKDIPGLLLKELRQHKNSINKNCSLPPENKTPPNRTDKKCGKGGDSFLPFLNNVRTIHEKLL